MLHSGEKLKIGARNLCERRYVFPAEKREPVITITVNGEEVPTSELSSETLENLKNWS